MAGDSIQPSSLANQLAAFCPALLSQFGFYGLVLEPQCVAIEQWSNARYTDDFAAQIDSLRRAGAEALLVDIAGNGGAMNGQTLPRAC